MNKPRSLTIHPAGAGSGKTFKIQTTLGKWVEEKRVQPEKIVAVTFTDTAAAELVGRIREELVGKGMLEEALRLDLAYISTIHGFGRRLLEEYAFEAGISPTLRKLSADEERMLAAKAIAASDIAEDLMESLEKDGYTYSFTKKASGEELFRNAVLALTVKLRSISEVAQSAGLSTNTSKRIEELYGPTEDEATLTADLSTAINMLLAEFPNNLSGIVDLSPSAKKALWNDYRNLRLATRPGALEDNWQLWNKLASLKNGTRPQVLPERYRTLGKNVVAAAKKLTTHPGPLSDAQAHASKLLQAASDTLLKYSGEKQKRGLLDFMDMLSQSHKLFAENSDILASFVNRIDCLVVDEFQDTSPLQFSLLWNIVSKGSALPSIIVGDVKQAIMGFQNADERLLQELCRQYPESVDPLGGNWRSSKELMGWINPVGAAMFGEGYTTLEPMAGFESRVQPLEVIKANETLSDEGWASYTVNRIMELLHGEEPAMIWDKKLNKHRQLRGGDIAIIAYKNKRLVPYAEALRSAGIRCRLEEGKWLETRVVQLALHALAYVTDTDDRHAALYLAVTELGSTSLKEGLASLIKDEGMSDDIIGKLDMVADGPSERTVECLLDEIIDALDLYGTIAKWPEGDQVRANLLKLQAECREFMGNGREAMASGGYYGSDAKTFMAWLKAKTAQDEKNNTQPGASIIDDEAVRLLTWHKSKGGEWPVVAVCGMQDGEFPRLPSTKVDYEDFSELETIMDRAWIKIHPKFNSSETNKRIKADLIPESHENTKRLLYVALTRAREKVILEWPEYLKSRKEKGDGTYWSEFKHAAKAELTPSGMSVNDTEISCRVSTIAVKEPLEIESVRGKEQTPAFGRGALEKKELPSALTPEAVRPSSLHDREGVAAVSRRDLEYGNGLEIELDGVSDALQKGTMLHRAFEVLSGHPERSSMLPDIVGCELSAGQQQDISRAVAEFDGWLSSELKVTALHPEMPLLTLDELGSVVAGFADMVVETEDGLWVVDHKSDQVITDALLEERFNLYYPQVKSYAEALERARKDKPVKGIILNWFSYGKVSAVNL